MKKKLNKKSLTALYFCLLLLIGYHFAYFYLRSSFNRFTTIFDTSDTQLIDLDNNYYIEAERPKYGSLTGKLTVTTMDGNNKLTIWKKFPKESTSTYQTYSSITGKTTSRTYDIENNSINLEFTDLSEISKAQIKKLEAEAKIIWGNSVLDTRL